MFRLIHHHIILASVVLILGFGGCNVSDQVTDSLPPVPEGIIDHSNSDFSKGDHSLSYEDAWGDLPVWKDRIGFETLFAPDDPTARLEVSLIDEVVSACLEDENCHPQQRPSQYNIRYAVYNLTDRLLIQKLIQAEEVGVDVQILIEDEQLSPQRSWLDIDERFEEAGLWVESNHLQLEGHSLEFADLIGIRHFGLMHLKMRLFEMPNQSYLLTGSYNPNTTSPLNDESLHFTDNQRLIDLYKRTYWSILYDIPFENEWNDDENINVLFTPASHQRAVTKIFEWLESEKEQILLMMFSLRNVSAPHSTDDLVNLLKRKHAAGVNVAVITDQKQSDGINRDGKPIYDDDQTEDLLRSAGIPVFEVMNRQTPYTAMHHKVAILGRQQVRVISGASNWTKSGLGSRDRLAKNVESVIFINSHTLDENYTGDRYLGQWVKVLRRYAEHSNDDHYLLSIDNLLEQLFSAYAWPELPIKIMAKGVNIHHNDQVMIGGNHSSLGLWDVDELISLGPIDTEQSEWISPRLWFPIGTEVKWKFAVTNDEGYFKYWESGSNRQSTVTLPLSRDNSFISENPWR